VGSGYVRELVVPLVTVFNLEKEDAFAEVEEAVRSALASLPVLEIKDHEVDVIPLVKPDGSRVSVTRINVDLWEHPARTKAALQELATRVAKAFQAVCGADRKVKVVLRPYDVEKSGWVAF
jgi:hypothetical protein